MSEMAPYRRNVHFKKGEDYREYFATRFTASANYYSDYVDLYFCEDVAGEPIIDEGIFRMNFQTFNRVVTDEEAGLVGGSNSDSVDTKAIIHGRIKMDSLALIQLYQLLGNIIHTMPDSPYTDAATGQISINFPADSPDMFEDEPIASDTIDIGANIEGE